MTEAVIDGVEAALGRREQAFEDLNADLLEDLYTEDADWMNAYGTRRRGSAEIVAYLRELFADPRFAAGSPAGPPQVEIRQVAPRVAIASTYLEIEGQERIDGTRLPRRRNHSMKILLQQPDGRWRIVSEMYMDAREEVTHASMTRPDRT